MSLHFKMPSIINAYSTATQNLLLNLIKILAISGSIIFFVYFIDLSNSGCPASLLSSSTRQQRWPPASSSHGDSPKDTGHDDSPTNISHIVFGLVTAIKTWRVRKPYVESWWRPNVTRGYLIFDEHPIEEFLPWPATLPAWRVSDDTSQLEKDINHISPIMVRMVHAILETFREGDEGVRWYMMAFEDSIFFVENLVDVLAKYDHTKYYNIGDFSETVMSNHFFSFEMGFGGAGIALSYPLAAAMAKDLKGCISRYPYVRSADLIIQYCVDEFGVPLTVERGIHQIDLLGDISGYLSAHPQAPLVSLHHLDFVNPIFPNMDTFQSTNQLMKAGKYGQSRLLQQTICYEKSKNWSFSVSWGYVVHIYENIHSRTSLKRPLETFMPWVRDVQPPKFMFNTRQPCETPLVFFFHSIETNEDEIITTYVRSPSPTYPICSLKGNATANEISKIQVISPTTKLQGYERSECCDIVHEDGATKALVLLRACMDKEIIA